MKRYPGQANLLSHASWAVLALATSALVCKPTLASPTGFTGNFDPNNSQSTWSFTPAIDPTYLCPGGYVDVTCVEVNGSSAVITSDPFEKSPPYQIKWTWTNSYGKNYYVSFNYNFTTDDSSIATIRVGDELRNNLVDGANSSLGPTLVSNGEIIEFTITTSITSSTTSTLSITNFNYSVPAPLPATGAAAAFGYSRRLRRRIKGEPGSGSGSKRRTPAHPSAYLNLAPAAVQSVPLSFSYPGAAPLRRPGSGVERARRGGTAQPSSLPAGLPPSRRQSLL